jgi:hypothetical protein
MPAHSWQRRARHHAAAQLMCYTTCCVATASMPNPHHLPPARLQSIAEVRKLQAAKTQLMIDLISIKKRELEAEAAATRLPVPNLDLLLAEIHSTANNCGQVCCCPCCRCGAVPAAAAAAPAVAAAVLLGPAGAAAASPAPDAPADAAPRACCCPCGWCRCDAALFQGCPAAAAAALFRTGVTTAARVTFGRPLCCCEPLPPCCSLLVRRARAMTLHPQRVSGRRWTHTPVARNPPGDVEIPPPCSTYGHHPSRPRRCWRGWCA